MLVLKKVFDFYDFIDEFRGELEGLPREAVVTIFDSLCESMFDGKHTVTDVSDYLRFHMRVSNLDDVIHDYGYMMDLTGLEGSALIEAVTECLHDYTYLLGTYQKDGDVFFIFDES